MMMMMKVRTYFNVPYFRVR